MAKQNSTTNHQRQVIAKLRKDFERHRQALIENDRRTLEQAKAQYEYAKKNLRAWDTTAFQRSAPCCPSCEKYIPGGQNFCPVCGDCLVIFDLRGKKRR